MNLLASSVQTTSGSSVLTAPVHIERLKAAAFLLTVSAAATAAGDTLDVYLQSSIDGGTTYDDFVHFTQVLGNGGAKKFIARWMRDLAPTAALSAPGDATLAAGVAQGPVGTTWRVKWVIVSASAPSFTFKVDMSAVGRG